ncbi:MAG: hypothetical protein ACI917_001306 [Patiriisocius sp.]
MVLAQTAKSLLHSMEKQTNKYLITALLLGLLFHGASIFFTLETTYDALIHLFFAEHYSQSWFEPWNYSWYTGFTVMGYPPLVHQSIALLSFIGGLKFGMFTVALVGVVLFITGVYRFALLITANRKVAGYASILAVFSSSFVETLHIFGQLPSIIGISILLHTLPEIYLWLRTGKLRYLITSFAMLAVTITSHHLTPIFGMVFFVFPLIGMVVMDASKEKVGSIKAVTFLVFLASFKKHFKRIIIFGIGSLMLIIGCILPYWINTKNNPITQVPIPHGSRDNFLEITSSGLIFFIIPWGILLFLFPYLFYRFFSKRHLFFGISFTILTVLGTGGTTAIPLTILGENAFNILTLDRFTLWASIIILPIFGEFAYRFIEGDFKKCLQERWGPLLHRLVGGLLVSVFIFIALFTVSLGKFKPTQPQKINMLPIVNFLNRDDHDKWRFLPLGFGDQMALLSAKTNAMTVDGNYHSARRLPELTSRAVERLENSKFRGVEGIGSLQQFLAVPDKYHLKYIFSNDKFYDPVLYFSGWHRLQQLENGIRVWERAGVKPLPSVLPKNDVPLFQKLLWGIIPLSTLIFALLINLRAIWRRTFKTTTLHYSSYLAFGQHYSPPSKWLFTILSIWVVITFLLFAFGGYTFYLNNTAQRSSSNVVKAYYDALDIKNFEKAYSYINPQSRKSKSQYMLEVSVSDGLLRSYAKLDAISTQVIQQNDSVSKLKTTTKWVTPLAAFNKEETIEVKKIDSKWYITPQSIDLDIPPDQLFSENSTRFYNHGRRRVTSGKTYHEDVLKQPVVEVLSAKLMHVNDTYSIVGSIQNIDFIPADIAIKATLYSKENKVLATFNVKDIIKHKLFAKESSNFRIDFEGIAWSNFDSRSPEVADGKKFTSNKVEEKPVSFNLQVAANVATTDLYDGLALQSIIVTDGFLEGVLFNTGIQNATIPQLLISYYDEKKSLVNVDRNYLEESVRPQRKLNFKIELPVHSDSSIINTSLQNVFINGLPNEAITNKIVPKRILNQETQTLIPVHDKTYSYIGIQVNSYIDNPQ